MPILIQRGEGPTLRAKDDLRVADLEELWDLLVMKYFCKHLVLQYVQQVGIEWRGETSAFIAAQLRTEAATWYKDRHADHGCDLLDEAFNGAWGWLVEVAIVGMDNTAGPRNQFADRVAKDIVSLVNEAATALECNG